MPESAYSKPFVIETSHETHAAHRAVPRSRVVITSALRESGLLSAMPPEELRSLVLLLTFLTANGNVFATLPQIADAMGLSEAKARLRMKRLAEFAWDGKPVVVETERESGLDTFSTTDSLVGQMVIPPEPEYAAPHPIQAAGRDLVVAQSRERYSRSRADVELDIALRSGWELPDSANLPDGDSGRDYLMRRLTKLGVDESEARILVGAYPPERIFRQTQWMRWRSAKAPGRFLVAAIEGDYDEPFALREQAARQTASAAGEAE